MYAIQDLPLVKVMLFAKFYMGNLLHLVVLQREKLVQLIEDILLDLDLLVVEQVVHSLLHVIYILLYFLFPFNSPEFS